MDRTIFYSQEQARVFDWLWTEKEPLIGLGFLEQDVAGTTTAVVSGLVATASGPASLTINLAQGRIYQQAPVDSTAYGALASDSTLIMQQGFAAAQQVTFTTAGLAAGQSQWALVQASFSQTDQVRVGDPTGGILFYWNSANPAQPFQGPNNNGQSQNTLRRTVCSVQVIYGAAATTGSEVPPQPTTGWVPLYLVDLTFGQTAVVQGQILTAGPSVGTGVPNNYPQAPFLAGLLNQHHKGTAGEAPQIDLTAEVKNTLPLSNLPASDTSGGGLPVFKIHAGNPNGSVAGNFNVNGTQDFCYDSTNKVLYACITSGTTSTAVWQLVGQASTSTFSGGTTTGTANAQVISSTIPAGFSLTAGFVVTAVIGAGLTNTGSATLNVDATGVIAINKNTGSGNVPLTGGELVAGNFVSFIYTGTVWLLQAATLGQLATMNIGQWLKNDGSGNLTIKNGALLGDDGSGNFNILNTAVTPGTYTRPKVTVAASGQVTAAANGAFPTYTVLTSGTGLYTTPANAKRLRIRMIAGGGSGSSSASAGGNGGQSVFGSTTANGGLGAASRGPTGGAGGSGGTTATGTEIIRLTGMQGNSAGLALGGTTSGSINIPGGAGGVGPFGGAGVGTVGSGTFGSSAVANTGAGGSGQELTGSGTNFGNGCPGGGSAEYVEFVINNPAATYNWTVGAGGTAPTNAGNGGSGVILIEELYD